MKKIGHKNSGLTLIEALIWFAVFMAVVVSVFMLYKNARQEQMLNNSNKELSTIYTKSRAFYDEGGNGATVDSSNERIEEIAIHLGLIPSSLKIKNNKIQNAYGGEVWFINKTNGFVIIYESVPTGESCMKLVNSQRKVGWEFVVVGAANRIYYNTDYTPSSASNLCKGEGGVAAGSIALQFASCPSGC